MAKKKAALKVNRMVTVDASLDARMRKVKGDVNWSAVASAAFERELERQTSGEVIMDLVERLRAEKAAGDRDAYDVGWQDGEDYVTRKPTGGKFSRNPAALAELKRVDRFIEDQGYEFNRSITEATPELIAAAISGVEGDTEEFWAHATDTDMETIRDPEYLRAFVLAMQHVYNDVKGQL